MSRDQKFFDIYSLVIGVLAAVAGFAAATVMYARAVSTSGQSVGNRAMSTKVVDTRNSGGES